MRKTVERDIISKASDADVAHVKVQFGGGHTAWPKTSVDVNSVGGVPRFRFRNPEAPSGVSAVRVAVLKEGRGLKVVAKAAGLPLVLSQLAVGLRITTG